MRYLSVSRKIYAFGSIILGILLLFWPQNALRLAAYASGIVIMGGGITAILTHFRRKSSGWFGALNLVTALLFTGVGIWIFTNPEDFASIIPTAFGYIMILSGVINLLETFALTRARYRKWWASLLTAIVTILMGMFLVNHAFGIASTMVRLAGIFLLFNGLSNLWISGRIDRYVFFGGRKKGGSGKRSAQAGAGPARRSEKYDTSDPDIIDADEYQEL